jgi:hypothetical protein
VSRYKDEPFFKVNRRLFESSVWEEDPATRVLWLTLLALAQDPINRSHGEGVIIITPGNLLRKAFLPRDEFDRAIQRLTSPDMHSRTNPGEARLEILENGYRIPAFAEYHDRDKYEGWLEQKRIAGQKRAARAARQGGKFTKADEAHVEYDWTRQDGDER